MNIRLTSPSKTLPAIRRPLAWLQPVIIALLLGLLVTDRLDDLRRLVTWPVLAVEPPPAAPLPAPNDFVKQQYQNLQQTIAGRKQMIRHARQVIDLSNRDIERYTFDLSVAELALNKLRAEYALEGLEE